MALSTLVRYYETIRHLKPEQIYGRLWFRFARRTLKRDGLPPRSRHDTRLIRSIARRRTMTGPDRFTFLGLAGECRSSDAWNDPSRAKLWLYNLHYFDDLTADRADERREWHLRMIERWIDENPAKYGNGWEPYPVSLRVVNWVKWSDSSGESPQGFDQSLALQARWLSRRVEWHLLGNHLLANAKALIFAGRYFTGREATSWTRQGLRILERELPAQLLDDGAHAELSPMYHAIALEDLLDLINVAHAWGEIGERVIADWERRAAQMLAWAHAMAHPDGEVSFFNDTALGIAPTVEELESYATRLGVSSSSAIHSLSASGYIRLARGPATLLADAAPIGVDYQPGHAHADTLSFELSIDRIRVLVNTGTSTYVPGRDRQFERSTAAHNTIEIDGKNSSDVWAGFRVGRRARPCDVNVSDFGPEAFASAAHDGYTRLPGAPVHCRKWRLNQHELEVCDRINGGAGRSVARFYFHPDVKHGRDGEIVLQDGRTARWWATGGDAKLVAAEWHPRFGTSILSSCVEVRASSDTLTFVLRWDG